MHRFLAPDRFERFFFESPTQRSKWSAHCGAANKVIARLLDRKLTHVMVVLAQLVDHPTLALPLATSVPCWALDNHWLFSSWLIHTDFQCHFSMSFLDPTTLWPMRLT